MEYQGYDISAAQALIPKLQRLLMAFRNAGFPVFHTREGKSPEESTVLVRTKAFPRPPSRPLHCHSP